MRYIIDIDDTPFESNGKKIWKASSFSTLVFDENGLDRLEQVQEHDGCDGCKFLYAPKEDYPCFDCMHNYTDRWERKTEDIQVGDEVEHDDGVKAVVYQIAGNSIYAIRRSRYKPDEMSWVGCQWFKENCTRTGKTYPELIKALEELPKEGE